MLFQRLIMSSLFIGVVAGLCLSLAQVLAVNPIIFAAETFEVADEAPAEATSAHHHDSHDHGHDHHSHDHGEEWGPEDGAERTGYTVLSNVLAGIGFGALLLPIMALLQLRGVTQVTLGKSVLWGVAGFLAFFVAPAIGLPPEIPGIEAAPIENRQVWWLFAVAAAAAGLLVLAFAPMKAKAAGIVLLALPYVVSIPHHQGPAFSHPDPEAVSALTQLHQQFIVMSGATNLLFWLVLAVAAGWALKRRVLNNLQVGPVEA